ncbi:MAG TPA: hypothetical protein VIL46_15135, partial [Gemmataceae bacterium]
FYAEALARVGGGHGRRLRAEAEALRQPFGGARQHLNQVLARQRAEQLQERRLAVLFAEMGYPDASRQRARSIPTVSARMLAEIHLRQTACRLALERGEPAAAAGFLPQVEDLLERAIGCGALPDPWNILGFQGLFPLFQAREDSVRDTRHEELIAVVGRQLDLYAGVLAGFAAAGDAAGQDFLRRGMERFAAWWDRFATAGVGDLPRVHGGERAEAAAHVARALARWREQPGRGNEVAFWRAQREGFRSPSAFAPVIEALMHNRDHRAALALLLAWLSEAESIPLEQGDASFHDLLPRWLRATLALPPEERDAQVGPLGRVFELLEANAEAFWHAPDLPAGPPGAAAAGEEGEGEDLYRAAYEGMSYRDSTGGDEGAVIGGEPGGAADAFPLEEQAAYLEQRLKFLATLARLWQAAVASELAAEAPQPPAAHRAWLAAALAQQEGLLTFLDRLTALPVPEPAAPFETVVEFDRRQAVKQSLIELALSASVELGRAVRGLRALVGGGRGTPEGAGADALPWEAVAVRLEQAIGRADPGEVRRLLPRLVPEFRREPLLYVPIASGGSPRLVLRVRSAQAFLRTLLERLPPLGLLRETYQLLRLARSMEQNTDVQGRRVSEFDQLFRTALRTSVEALLDAAAGWGPAPPAEGGGGEEAGPLADQALADALHRITGAYLTLWVEHSQTLRLSVLEGLTDADWERQREFIREYGGDLFTAQFLSGVNLRGVLHRGVAAHLEALAEQADPLAPPRLLADLSEGRVDRAEAVARLETILYALAEHYEEYRDYNATTAQSDYGENLHQLMDFLRLKVQYERSNWRMKPLVLTHEVLCR